MSSEMGEEKGKKGFKSSSEGTGVTVAAIADVMRPTEFSTAPTLGTENPSSNYSPIAVGTGNLSLDQMIKQSAQRNGVDQRLIMAVMRQESSFNPRATSYKGARGLMQLMPATASRFGVTDIYDPAQNIEGGTRYLRFLLNTFNGDIELALAGYNAGEHAVFRYGNRIPPYRETQDYVRKISAHYERLTTGEPVLRPTLPAETRVTKKGEVGFITVGQTMTQY
ncbi:MAG: lytic transglycosylase domain-containing protein [Acidobacteria bacterium]|nr:lytic transglycosylase domain-containing protein [Acidobacteriota bacterium]